MIICLYIFCLVQSGIEKDKKKKVRRKEGETTKVRKEKCSKSFRKDERNAQRYLPRADHASDHGRESGIVMEVTSSVTP